MTCFYIRCVFTTLVKMAFSLSGLMHFVYCEKNKINGIDRGRGTKLYQDEEALVGHLLMLRDGGEHRQHQAAEHQQKTERHTQTQTKTQ